MIFGWHCWRLRTFKYNQHTTQLLMALTQSKSDCVVRERWGTKTSWPIIQVGDKENWDDDLQVSNSVKSSKLIRTMRWKLIKFMTFGESHFYSLSMSDGVQIKVTYQSTNDNVRDDLESSRVETGKQKVRDHQWKCTNARLTCGLSTSDNFMAKPFIIQGSMPSDADIEVYVLLSSTTLRHVPCHYSAHRSLSHKSCTAVYLVSYYLTRTSK